jgi:hypothetical protein
MTQHSEISPKVRRQYRVFTRRKLSELRTFYKSVLVGKANEKVKMQAAERLQELYTLELEERQLEDKQLDRQNVGLPEITTPEQAQALIEDLRRTATGGK